MTDSDREQTKLVYAGRLLAALVICLGALAAASKSGPLLARSMSLGKASYRDIDPELGFAVFRQRCLTCHFMTHDSLGPPLVNIGIKGDHRVPGMNAGEYIYRSIVTPSAFRAPGTTRAMPADIASALTERELLSITHYLWSQGGQPDDEFLRELAKRVPPPKYDPALSDTSWSLASVEKGKQLFFGKLQCSACHSVRAGEPGLLAPNLMAIGANSRKALRKSLLEPAHEIVPGYEEWQVVEEGRAWTGRKLPAPDRTIRLLTPGAKLGEFTIKEFDASNLEPFDDGQVARRSSGSPMPTYAPTIAPAELEALLDFLNTLR